MFPCDRCGLCCQHVTLSDETKELDRGDGVCRNFDEELKLCRVYEDRPLICRVREQYETNYRSRFTWSQFVEINQQACKILKSGVLTGSAESVDQAEHSRG